MARYIDAEKCPCKGCPIEYCYQNCEKYYAWLEGCDYDVEAVVAELNETGRKFCENVGCSKECENCEHGALMRTIIEIVRGKE